jgi:hypothetical protein
MTESQKPIRLHPHSKRNDTKNTDKPTKHEIGNRYRNERKQKN